MNVGNSNETALRFRQAPKKKHCPKCGEEMKEVERCNENGIFFVWYKCSKDNCNGQWLQKILQESQ